MKTFIVTIKPESPFGTPVRGDTLFGHFCWQAAYDDSLLTGGLVRWIDEYSTRPFAVFSSAFPVIENHKQGMEICLPRPAMPSVSGRDSNRMERVKKRKADKKKKWMPVPADEMKVDFPGTELLTDRELFERHVSSLAIGAQRMFLFMHDDNKKPVISFTQAHNSINRLTMTTGPGFDPYSTENFHYLPGLKLAVIVGIDEDAMNEEGLKQGFNNIGLFGFGRDASTGLGRFSVTDIGEVSLPALKPGAGCYTLSPSIPGQGTWKQHFALPFTRFGRHGAEMVLTGKPFKNPVVMADEGSVFIPEDNYCPDNIYIGSAVTGLSLAEPRTVAQGYSLYIPLMPGEVYECS